MPVVNEERIDTRLKEGAPKDDGARSRDGIHCVSCWANEIII